MTASENVYGQKSIIKYIWLQLDDNTNNKENTVGLWLGSTSNSEDSLEGLPQLPVYFEIDALTYTLV